MSITEMIDSVDIDSIEEAHYEIFCCRVADDRELENEIASAFLDSVEFFQYCKMTHEVPDYAVEEAFKKLYGWDAHWLTTEPLGCLRSYVEQKAKNKETI